MPIQLSEHDQLKHSAVWVLSKRDIAVPVDATDHLIVNAFREYLGLESLPEAEFTVPESLKTNFLRTIAEASDEQLDKENAVPVARIIGLLGELLRNIEAIDLSTPRDVR